MDVNRLIKLISKEKGNLSELTKCLSNLKKYEKEPVQNLKRLKESTSKAENTLKTLKLNPEITTPIYNYLDSLKSQFKAWEEKAKSSFGSELENKLKKTNFKIDGNYPELKTHFFTLQVDFDAFEVTIWYGPKQEKLAECDLSPEVVAKRLITLDKEIAQKRFDDKTFLSKLFEAYDRNLRLSGKKMGYKVPIQNMLLEFAMLIQNRKFRFNPIKKNFRSYSRAFFSFDLYRLQDRIFEGKELDLVSATQAYTRKKSDFLWIPSNNGRSGSYISHIKFREVNK